MRTDDKDTAARQELLRRAKLRMERDGRRGLRNRPPRPRRPEGEIREYRAALRDVRRAIEEQAREQVFPEIDSLLAEAGTRGDALRTDDWPARLAALMAAVRAGSEEAQAQAQQVADTLGDRVTERATEEQVRQVRAVLGVAPSFIDDERIGATLNAWKQQQEAFITRMTAESIQEIQDTVSRGVRSGRSTRDLQREIRQRFKVTDRRAELIARTEIGQLNAQITRERQTELGIDGYTWRTVQDERLRDEHEAREGQRFTWSNPPPDGHPGEAPNCFPSGAVINGSPFINKMYRHLYAGELTSIVRDDGVVLTATPNHPILTRDGFKPIKLIDKGEHVFGALNERLGVIDGNREHLVPEVSELFRALILSGVGGHIASGSACQFHGDGSDDEVDIIDIHGFLVREGASDVRQKLMELGLSDSDVMLAGYFLDGLRPGSPIFMSADHASDSFMRLRDLIVPLLIRHLTPLECFRLGLCSDMDASGNQMTANNIPGHAESFGDSIFAHAVLVHGAHAIRAQMKSIMGGPFPGVPRGVYPALPEPSRDNVSRDANDFGNLFDGSPISVKPFRVVDKFSTDCFSGHVYNLETRTGYFIADLHAVSNCRCVAEPLISDLLADLEAA